MKTQMIMGNQALALGALKAGVNLVAGYPGTPSSEIIEFIAKYKEKTGTYVEWSCNEKVAVEVAAGASYAGSRTLVTMKQVGLNVASDPVMCLSYVGVKGGMVIVSADDPGPISSQTEQDTRTFASFSKLPVFDPSTPGEAFLMIQEAFDLSERYNTPVIVRPTTRVDHAYESMEFPELGPCRKRGEFEKDTQRWVIFPRTSYMNHKRIFERNQKILPDELSASKWNFAADSCGNILKDFEEKAKEKEALVKAKKDCTCSGDGDVGGDCNGDFAFAAGGISYSYLIEALSILKKEFPSNAALKDAEVLKIGTPYPFPVPLAKAFIEKHRRVCVFEELDPVIEEGLIQTAGSYRIESFISGKLDGKVPAAGELSADIIVEILKKLLCKKEGDSACKKDTGLPELPELPVRPPVLCAGCPHRASFYAVKKAMHGKKTVYCGDIGCYTLGNAKPLDMCDTCLCMGADITMAQGFYHNEKDRACFSFIGDSTFFASGIPGIVNAVYNQARQTVCILDNSTTAMTGHQPHPGTGLTMMGEIVEKISIEKILTAVGVNPVITVNPFNMEEAIQAVKAAAESDGVSAIIFKAPCIAIAQKVGWKKGKAFCTDEKKCIGCRKCITELGCPALSVSLDENTKGKKLVQIEASLCTGCSLCAQVCPVNAIGERSGR